MGELFYRLMNSDTVLYILYFALALLFVIFLVYALSKEGRDEHGRAILGTACIYGAIALLIAANVYSYFSFVIMENIVIFSNAMRLGFGSFFLVADVAILILRKVR